MAPGMAVQVVPPSLERDHWKVGWGRPPALAVKPAALPAATVRLAGWALMTGFATSGGAGWVVLLLVPQPRPGRRQLRARLARMVALTRGREFVMMSSFDSKQGWVVPCV